MTTLIDDLRQTDPRLDDLVGRAQELGPLISSRAADGEAQRNVGADVVQAISDAELFRIMVPKRFGGMETDIRTHLAVSAAVANADGATAWITALTNVLSLIHI